MSIIIIGLPYFARDLCRRLKQFDPENRYLSVDTSGSKIDQLRYLLNIRRTDLLYCIGGHLTPGGAFRTAVKLNKPILLHWVGTDVLKAKKEIEDQVADLSFAGQCHHITDARWLQDELKEIGIEAALVHLVGTEVTVPAALPAVFRVLTYISAEREDFYGMPYIVQLAKDLPDVMIDVVGMAQSAHTLPQNVRLLGWVGDMKSQYENHAVFLRLTNHDGMPYSVVEGLAMGRYVGFTQCFPHTTHITNTDELRKFIAGLHEQHGAGQLDINQAGIQYVREQFNEEKVLTDLIRTFRTAIEGDTHGIR